jgi:glutamine synthetase
MNVIAEYLWLDGGNLVKDDAGNPKLDPTRNPEIRSKTKILDGNNVGNVEKLSLRERRKKISSMFDYDLPPTWGFDGSSTNQADGHDSDCVLKPVRVYLDPLRTRARPDYLSVLVLNEVFYVPGERPHLSNTRALLREFTEKYEAEEFWFGLEQEYTLMRVDDNDFSKILGPLGFPKTEGTFPEPQGKYYCGNGADKILGRMISEEHMFACLDAKLLIAGTNAEVMPGQWEYQNGNGTDDSNPLKVADDLVIARFLMSRITEKYGVVASLEPKPHPDWNGAGMHTNFSNRSLREDIACLKDYAAKLEKNHLAHIAVYGQGIEKRLTGLHETSSCDKFGIGVSDRGKSIRIPWQVAAEGRGYAEDRRPNANVDPYVAEARIIQTIMEG